MSEISSGKVSIGREIRFFFDSVINELPKEFEFFGLITLSRKELLIGLGLLFLLVLFYGLGGWGLVFVMGCLGSMAYATYLDLKGVS